MTYVILSLLLGVCACVCPIAGLSSKSKNPYMPVISFALCLLAIIVQLLQLKSYGEEWILIIDALDALDFVIPIFAIITVVLNALYIRKLKKRRNFCDLNIPSLGSPCLSDSHYNWALDDSSAALHTAHSPSRSEYHAHSYGRRLNINLIL